MRWPSFSEKRDRTGSRHHFRRGHSGLWFVLGYLGQPRRYHVYPPEFQIFYVLSTAGASILGVGDLLHMVMTVGVVWLVIMLSLTLTDYLTRGWVPLNH